MHCARKIGEFGEFFEGGIDAGCRGDAQSRRRNLSGCAYDTAIGDVTEDGSLRGIAQDLVAKQANCPPGEEEEEATACAALTARPGSQAHDAHGNVDGRAKVSQDTQDGRGYASEDLCAAEGVVGSDA